MRRYDGLHVPEQAYLEILANLTRAIRTKYGDPEERPSRHKQLYTEMHIGKDQWSRKFRGQTKFSFTEIEWLRQHFGAPRGWPYVEIEYAEALRRAHETLSRLIEQSPSPPPGQPIIPPSAASSGHPERRRRGSRK